MLFKIKLPQKLINDWIKLNVKVLSKLMGRVEKLNSSSLLGNASVQMILPSLHTMPASIPSPKLYSSKISTSLKYNGCGCILFSVLVYLKIKFLKKNPCEDTWIILYNILISLPKVIFCKTAYPIFTFPP